MDLYRLLLSIVLGPYIGFPRLNQDATTVLIRFRDLSDSSQRVYLRFDEGRVGRAMVLPSLLL